MKKYFSLISAIVLGIGAICAQEQPLNVTFTTPGDLEGWTVGNNASYEVANGQLNVDMVLQSNGKYRADLQWGNNNNANSLEFGENVQYLAIKFEGTRPNGNMTLEVGNGSNTCSYTNTPTGSVTTPAGNTIYYYQLNKSANYVTPYQARRIQFKIADCAQEPYKYTVDWIKTFATLDDVKAAAALADDGDDDMADVVVYNQTTKTGYATLTDAWKAAANGDVLSLQSDVTITERLNSNSRSFTIMGNGHTITRASNYTGILFLTSYGKDADNKNIPHEGPVTIEDATIDGANVSVGGQSIEAGNAGRFILNNVIITNCVSTSAQGVVVCKSNGGVTANNLVFTGCTIPAGTGEMFGGSNTIELSGACSFSVFLEGSNYVKDQGVTGGAVIIMFQPDESMTYHRNLEAQVVVGTQSTSYFHSGVADYDLVGRNNNLYLQKPIQDGIDNLVAESAPVTVYNLQGMVVRANVAASDALVALPAGMYIVNGKKIMVK